MLRQVQPEEMCDGDRKMVKMVDGQPATPEDAVEAADKPGVLEGINKGDLSNSIAFGFLVLGVITVAVDSNNVFFAYLLSFGLFSFCGGITNWLAIKVSNLPESHTITTMNP
jgi:hypothetical protein